MNAIEWVIALLALGFLGGSMFTLIRIEDKVEQVLEELRLTNKDAHGAEFDRAVEVEMARQETENR